MLEVEVDVDTEVIVNTNVEVTAGNMNIAIIEDTNDIEVTVNRQEYVITGDEIYIPKRFEDAPTWMQELITQVVDTSISVQIQDLNGISQSLESMIEAMEVAKNTYEISVISSNDIDERINTAVTTLNSAMNEADATVLEVAQTRVTPEEASAITVDVITAELAKTEAGTLGATVSNLQTAVANEEEARSTSIEILTSSIEGAFDANATAMNYLNTYVGLDEVGASTGTGLSGYLEGSTGIIGEADSKVVNNVYVDALGNAKSKFEYGSTVSVNGVTNTAGFGLSNSTGTGIGSEFWINAAKFKFTNNNKTGSKSPFTIDATGTVPEITFNGKVAFTNVTGYTPTDGSSSNMIKNSEFETGVSPWAFGWNPNGSTIDKFGLSENIHNADWVITGSTGSLTLLQMGRNTSTANDDVGVDIYPQGAWDYTKGYAVEAGKTYEFSVYVAAHRCKAKIGMYFFNSSGVQVGYSEIDYVTPLSGGKTIDEYTRIHVRATTPTGSATVLLYVRKKNTDAGQTNSWIWLARPFFGKVNPSSTAPIGYIASDGSLANNNTFAQKLGYISYADMVDAATRGQTIINGGYLRGELIEANSINAGQINAYAITGKHISGGTINGTKINGTEINGAVINGAVINGAVIKASYLDLDGAIQVLTNYHLCITQAKLDAVIAAGGTGWLYTNSTSMPDAIPVSIPDPVTGIDVIEEYRIPSLSVLNWNGGSASTSAHEFFVSGTFSASLDTGLHAYNVANAGVNTKAVKIKPVMSINAITMKTGVYGINVHSAPYSTAHCTMYFGNIQLCKLSLWTYPQESGGLIRFTIERYGQSNLNGINDYLDGTTFNILGISFSVSSYVSDYPPDMNGNPTGRDVETTITVTKAIGELGFNFLSGSIRFEVYAEKPTFSDCRASVSSTGININNMV